jgi:hypothetical protein
MNPQIHDEKKEPAKQCYIIDMNDVKKLMPDHFENIKLLLTPLIIKYVSLRKRIDEIKSINSLNNVREQTIVNISKKIVDDTKELLIEFMNLVGDDEYIHLPIDMKRKLCNSYVIELNAILDSYITEITIYKNKKKANSSVDLTNLLKHYISSDKIDDLILSGNSVKLMKKLDSIKKMDDILIGKEKTDFGVFDSHIISLRKIIEDITSRATYSYTGGRTKCRLIVIGLIVVVVILVIVLPILSTKLKY